MNNKEEKRTTPCELDELILDRLVDDDLSDNEYREVLRLVEEKPDGWRKLAFAFLESQAFEKDLLALNHFPETGQEPGQECSSQLLALPNSNGSASVRTQSPSKSQPSSHYEVDREVDRELDRELDRNAGFWKSTRSTLPALAACLAIAVTVGLYISEIKNRNQLQTLNTGNEVDTGGDPDFIELVSNDPDGGVQTPVFNHQNFDPGDYAREVKALKPRLQEVVNRSGWNADERTHMVPIKDKTGNRIIVPLNEIKLTPNTFEKYQ